MKIIFLLIIVTALTACVDSPSDVQPADSIDLKFLKGAWELTEYSGQGMLVDKVKRPSGQDPFDLDVMWKSEFSQLQITDEVFTFITTNFIDVSEASSKFQIKNNTIITIDSVGKWDQDWKIERLTQNSLKITPVHLDNNKPVPSSIYMRIAEDVLATKSALSRSFQADVSANVALDKFIPFEFYAFKSLNLDQSVRCDYKRSNKVLKIKAASVIREVDQVGLGTYRSEDSFEHNLSVSFDSLLVNEQVVAETESLVVKKSDALVANASSVAFENCETTVHRSGAILEVESSCKDIVVKGQPKSSVDATLTTSCLFKIRD